MSQTFSLQKSRQLLKEMGYDTWIVEKPFNPYTKKREDLFGFGDLLAIKEGDQGCIAIQACGEDASTHVSKLLKGYIDKNGRVWGPNHHLLLWLKTGNRFFIWSWVLRGKKGKRKMYQLREIEFLLEAGRVIHREVPIKEDIP